MQLSHEYTWANSSRWASVPTIMYHGTNGKNLAIILSQGLIPNPKKRSWQDDPSQSFHTPSRASLPGIYLTTNLMTALSAPKDYSKSRILVVVLVQSGNLLADEDDVKYRLNEGIPSHEFSVMQLYTGWQALNKNLITHDYTKQETENYLGKSVSGFIKNCLAGFEYRLKGGLTDQEKHQLIPLLRDGFYIALTRRAAHLGKYAWGYENQNYGIPIPPVGPAEEAFKKLEDQLTRTLKRLGRPEHLENKFSPNSRIETPITYSGKNKIISVVEILPYEAGKHQTRVKVRYPASGRVPEKLVADWTQAQGDWAAAVELGKLE